MSRTTDKKMKHAQVKKLFQAWNDGRADEAARLRVQAHLDECSGCRDYYEKMALLLAKPESSAIERLAPDPFLPMRIRALDRERPAAPAAARRFGALRASFAAMIIAAAIAAGVFLGNGLLNISRASDENDPAMAYYSTFSQAGFADDLQTIVAESPDEL